MYTIGISLAYCHYPKWCHVQCLNLSMNTFVYFYYLYIQQCMHGIVLTGTNGVTFALPFFEAQTLSSTLISSPRNKIIERVLEKSEL